MDPVTSNNVTVQDGGTVLFPDTVVNASTSVTVVVSNAGAGTGVINSISLGGSDSSSFQLLNLPPFPLGVPPNQQLRFGVRFSPQREQAASALLMIDLNGQVSTLNLQARSTQPKFVYSLSSGDPISPGGTIALGDAVVGQTTSVVVTVLNQGSADGQIAAVSVTGQGFSVSDLPIVPFTLHAGDMQHFTLNVAPIQPGPITGRLVIGTDIFTVTATGIGSRLTYTYTSAGSSVPVSENGTVVFPPAAVGTNSTLDFSIQNTGTARPRSPASTWARRIPYSACSSFPRCR